MRLYTIIMLLVVYFINASFILILILFCVVPHLWQDFVLKASELCCAQIVNAITEQVGGVRGFQCFDY